MMLVSDVLNRISKEGEIEISKDYVYIDALIEYIEEIDQFESLGYDVLDETVLFWEY